MIFFGKNLKFKHKVTLCLVMLGILINYLECSRLPGTFPYVKSLANGGYEFHTTKIILAYGIFVKMLMIAFFRKF